MGYGFMGATEKQMRFLEQLLAERPNYPRADELKKRMALGLAKQNASFFITELLAFPKPDPEPNGPAAIAPRPNVLEGDVPDAGTFTVVLPEGGHKTLRFKTARQGNFAGKVIIKARVGAEYEGMAHAEQGRVLVWKRALANEKAIWALRFLLQSKSAQLAAGKAYALESGSCWRCNRELTDPESIARGIGPECVKMVGG